MSMNFLVAVVISTRSTTQVAMISMLGKFQVIGAIAGSMKIGHRLGTAKPTLGLRNVAIKELVAHRPSAIPGT
jgi:hypothetical protein